MAAVENSSEGIQDKVQSETAESYLHVNLNDMQSFASAIARPNSARSDRDGSSGLDLSDPFRNTDSRWRPPVGDQSRPNGERPAGEPKEINDKEYKQLADEINRSGKIPQSLKDALERPGGGQIIDIDRLNDLIKDKGMKLVMSENVAGQNRLDLVKNGVLVDSVKTEAYPGDRPSDLRRRPAGGTLPQRDSGTLPYQIPSSERPSGQH
jgi:hypothetical protein